MYLRVFLAAILGTVLGAYVEPQVTSRLPASLQGPGVSKAVHATFAGGVATGTFWALGKAGVAKG